MTSAAAHGTLLAAHQQFIQNDKGDLIQMLDLVDKMCPDPQSQEWKDWHKHMGSLIDVWQRRRDGEMVDWPDAPAAPVSTSEELVIEIASKVSVSKRYLEKDERDKIRLERKAQLEGANGVGPSRNSNAPKDRKATGGPGRKRNAVLEDITIESWERKSKDKTNTETTKITYCIACDHRMVGKDLSRWLDHCENVCQDIKTWGNLYKRVDEELINRSRSNALEKGKTKNLPKVRQPAEEVPLKRQGTVLEHFNTTKINTKQQAHIDLLLFKFFICCAIPFAVLSSPFFRELLAALAMNYVIPDRSSFFTRFIAEESAVFGMKLKEYLRGREHLTLSFDGWSTRAKDEIYTFHTTTTSRRSFFVEGHVFKGVSILVAHDPKMYGAVAGDGGPNVRVGKREVHEHYPWILAIYDPSHNLNLFLKDVGKLFKELLSTVSGISNYFGKSNYGTHQLNEERKKLGIREGMKSASETRFSSSYLQAKAIQDCIPAIHACMDKKTLTFDTPATKKLVPFLQKNSQEHYKFMGQLSAFVQLLAPGANAIKTLESQATTCADVFYAWVCIAWHLEELVGNPSSGLRSYREPIMEIYNLRFDQMMADSSHEVFFLAYWLHPLFRHNGGIQLSMPPLSDGQKFDEKQRPELFKRLLRSALDILKGEQQRLGGGGKEEATALIQELTRWAYQLDPFPRFPWNMDMTPLTYWRALESDSNCRLISRIAIKVFSISPSEICDERTASRLGWFNAARRSSMTPERLVECAKLHDFYMHGLTDGDSDHTAHIHVPKVNSKAAASSTTAATAAPATKSSETNESPNPLPTQTYSAPTLMDLLNEDNISPADVDRSTLDAIWFQQPDPFDLAESDRLDAQNPDITRIVRCSTRWKMADLVKLNSPLLSALIKRLSGDTTIEIIGGAKRADPATAGSSLPAGQPEDWDIDDLV